MKLTPSLDRRFLILFLLVIGTGFNLNVSAYDTLQATPASNKKLAYIVSDTKIPFWSIMAKGVQDKANLLGYTVTIYSSNNEAKRELENTFRAIQQNVAGIIISPTSSLTALTLIKFAKKANIPVVISDIGVDSNDYVSYISSDNKNGAYQLGKLLGKKMLEHGWAKGRVGIIAIPQKRANGRARTAGFMQAMKEDGIKAAGISQQATFSYQETYDFSMEFITQSPNLRAIWLQGSNRYQAASDAIMDAGKQDEILLVSFDAEPIFIKLIANGILAGSAMQQPYLMGQNAMSSMGNHLLGKTVNKEVKVPVLVISADNIGSHISRIKRNVLGMDATLTE